MLCHLIVYLLNKYCFFSVIQTNLNNPLKVKNSITNFMGKIINKNNHINYVLK